jgi:cytochrome c-type biogenesis protein CcmH/NrfG
MRRNNPTRSNKSSNPAENDARGFYNIGRVLAQLGELERAVQNFQRALQLEPGEAEIVVRLGDS